MWRRRTNKREPALQPRRKNCVCPRLYPRERHERQSIFFDFSGRWSILWGLIGGGQGGLMQPHLPGEKEKHKSMVTGMLNQPFGGRHDAEFPAPVEEQRTGECGVA